GDNRLVLLVSAFAGALFLVVSDLIVRLIFPLIATETPVGVVTAFIGAPVFVYLLKKNGKTR
ncbi:MAG: iron chelate uptake ABC transporter family permease subunit, partial [Deltaproteobacteria bacterium]|nr:iron chelate uptake ABC transporter family permease subunit [Deltaproteobacteria bacterium]